VRFALVGVGHQEGDLGLVGAVGEEGAERGQLPAARSVIE